MLFSEIFFTSVTSLRSNPVRTFLTALAIIIGIGSVIAMLSIGSGAQKLLEEEIKTLGGRILWVSGSQRVRGGVKREYVQLEIKDAEALREYKGFDWEISTEMKERRQIKFGNSNFNAQVGAYWSNFFDLRDFEIEHGRGFTENEDLSRQRVVVIGSDIPKELKTNYKVLLNNDIQINGIPYKVIGVLKKRGSQGWESPDNEIYAPLQTASARIFGSKKLRNIMVKISNDANVEEAMLNIESVMRVQHDIGPGQENDFRINDWFQYRDLEKRATAIFTALLTGIASISLIVGGIGVMNIMLVSVTERTREIGLRKALGATNRVIMIQFITEAVLLCLFGGILGIILGTFLVYIFSFVSVIFGTEFPFFIPINAIIGSLAFSIMVGLFFGIWPAKRAARLDPAVSLRYE